LLYLNIPWTVPGVALKPELLFGDIAFDVSYLPIYVAHLLWAMYVALFYRRLLSRLNERGLARALSRYTVVNMGLSAAAAIFLPYIWVASIGWGGFVLGVKLLTLAGRPDINAVANRRLRGMGLNTMANLGILTLLGLAGAAVSFAYVSPNATTQHAWVYVSCLVTMGMAWLSLNLVAAHVRSDGVSRVLGLLGRSRSATIASSAA
jgi:hypothetical protein